MRIVSPSYKRAGNMATVSYLGLNVTIAVHEFEAEKYKKAYPENKIMVLSDAARKNMARVRNEILENTIGEDVVMIDDDVSKIGYYENMIAIYYSPEQVCEFIENGFLLCRELGTVMWGINLQSDPDFYRIYTPFSFLSPVLGTFCCIINKDGGIRYDSRLCFNEDYDFFLQVIKKYHKVLRLNKYHYMAAHIDMDMGCAAYRTIDEEKRQANIMIKKWGSKIVSYDFDKSTNPRVRVPLKGL